MSVVSRLAGPLLFGALLAGAIFFVWPMSWTPLEYNADQSSNIKYPNPISKPESPPVVHLPTPSPTRALYMTQCFASTPSLRARLIKLADQTEINAIVLDLKDYSGRVAFPSTTAVPGGKGCAIADFKNLVKELHDRQIYVIGRLTVFQDPVYTKAYPEQAVQNLSAEKAGATNTVWHDRKGLAFVDVGAKPFWDYIVALAREAYNLGVDEINFDYIRYPSDGNMKDARYTLSAGSYPEMLEKFFAYLREKLDDLSMPLSADLFGLVTTNYDDLGIGQVLERALPYFDFIDPMVYPSHYPKGFNGWSNPNARPYDIIRFSLSRAVARTIATTTSIGSLAYERIGTSTPAVYAKPAYSKNKIRPWLQDFDYPIPYTPEMVRAQIQATYDVGLDSWLLWDPRNEYTPSALGPQ